MIKLQGCVDQNYMVLGLGRSGMASVGALTASGAKVICWDDDEEKRSLASLKGFQIKNTISDLVTTIYWRSFLSQTQTHRSYVIAIGG